MKARLLRCEVLETRQLLSVSGPATEPPADVPLSAAPPRPAVSAAEQEFVYLINRARHDPVAYQVERSLSVDLSYVTPRAPLAVNDSLFGSAWFHSDEMATYNYFGHQSSVTGDWPNKMARDYGYELPGNWADDANYIESIAAGYSTTYATLDALIVDAGINPPGHRNHLLGIGSFYADNREIGVGHAYNAGSTYRNYWSIHATRTDPADTFLTGVVFDDLDGDDRYDAGEGLSGVTLTVGAQSTTTNAAGGWALEVAAGQHTVTASGGSFSGTAASSVTVGSDSVEVDFVSGRSWGIVDFDVNQPLGTVDFLELAAQQPDAGELRYALNASRDGTLTAELTGGGIGLNTLMTLYSRDAGGQLNLLDSGQSRVDYDAAVAGGEYVLHVTDLTADADLRFTNLLERSGDAVSVYGTTGDDQFAFTPGASYLITIKGVDYSFSAAGVATVAFDGAAGQDTALLTGSAGADSVKLWPDHGELSGTGFLVTAANVEAITAEVAGGNDTLWLYDSAGDDTLVSSPQSATLAGPGFSHQAQGHEVLLAYAKEGGTDTVKMYDSAGDDQFESRPHVSWLSGNGHFSRAKYFENVLVYAKAGGTDTATMYDSTGNDVFDAGPQVAWLSGSGSFVRAKFFESVAAYASSGGDYARLYDSSGNDVFTGTTESGQLSGAGFSISANYFDAVHAFAGAGGTDVAYLYDSTGNDTLVAKSTFVKFTGTGFYNRVNLFDYVHAYGKNGGQDTAYLYDSDGDDTFTGGLTSGRLAGPNSYLRAKFFEIAYAVASDRNDNDTATLEAGTLWQLLGDWENVV